MKTTTTKASPIPFVVSTSTPAIIIPKRQWPLVKFKDKWAITREEHQIIRVTLKYGRSDDRPIFTMSIGIGLSLVGTFGLIEMVVASGGIRYELAMAAFGIVGGSMIFDTVKQRFFLEVQKKKDVSRLVLSKNAKKKDFQDFCQQLRSIYRYDITDAT